MTLTETSILFTAYQNTPEDPTLFFQEFTNIHTNELPNASLEENCVFDRLMTLMTTAINAIPSIAVNASPNKFSESVDQLNKVRAICKLITNHPNFRDHLTSITAVKKELSKKIDELFIQTLAWAGNMKCEEKGVVLDELFKETLTWVNNNMEPRQRERRFPVEKNCLPRQALCYNARSLHPS